jgi:hypothetical protein
LTIVGFLIICRKKSFERQAAVRSAYLAQIQALQNTLVTVTDPDTRNAILTQIQQIQVLL